MNRTLFIAALPTTLYLWGASLALGFVSTEGVFRATPKALDVDVYQPGALLLAEHFRVFVKQIGAATASGFFAFLLGQGALVLGRARLSAVAMDWESRRTAYRPLLDRVVPFGGLFVAQWLSLGLIFTALALSRRALPRVPSTFAPAEIVGPLIVVAAVAGICLCVVLFFELFRLALYAPADGRSAFFRTVHAFRARGGSLALRRSTRALLSVVVGLVVSSMSLSPPLLGFSGAVLNFVVAQVLALACLGADVLLLSYEAECLLQVPGERTPERAVAAELSSGAPPTGNVAVDARATDHSSAVATHDTPFPDQG